MQSTRLNSAALNRRSTAPRATLSRLWIAPLWVAPVLSFCVALAQAQVVDPNLWETNGTVYATTLLGNTLYIGGDFTRITPGSSGGAMPLDPTSGAPTAGFPNVAGIVSAIASDGAGGWYLGGNFSRVGHAARSNLAHVLASGDVAEWNPGANSPVFALAVSGGIVYAGGHFGFIGGQTRNYLASLDAATGLATAWDPHPNSDVLAILLGRGMVFVGGYFTSIEGQVRNHIAALDEGTGLLASWNPNVDGVVLALALDHGTVYAGGDFTRVGYYDRRNDIAALHPDNGLVTDWNAGASGDGYVKTIAASNGVVYAGGTFVSIGGQARNCLAALDQTNGLAMAWNPNPDGEVDVIALDGNTVYVGGSFGQVSRQPRMNLAALDATRGFLTAWNPAPDGGVRCIAVAGGTPCVGGSFTSIGGIDRNRLAALDVTTGWPTAWNPGADGDVLALAAKDTVVYAAGAFITAGGQTRHHIAALGAVTGTATNWNPGAYGPITHGETVTCLAVSGNTVYAGGDFFFIGGWDRSQLAAIDATTGEATDWDPSVGEPYSVGDPVKALAVGNGVVYVGGDFETAGGQERHGVAAFDASTGQVTRWNPNAYYGVNALALLGANVYVGGDFCCIGGGVHYYLAALDTATGLATDWSPSPWSSYPTVYCLAASGNTLYVGGWFESIGDQPREGLAAFDASTGLVTSWNPNLGGHTPFVFSITADGPNVYVGGAFDIIGGVTRSGIAAFHDSATPALLAQFEADTIGEGIRLRWQFGQPNRVVGVVIERAESSAGPWVMIPLEVRSTSDGFVADDYHLDPSTTYFYRLTAEFDDGSHTTFGPMQATSTANAPVTRFTAITPNPVSTRARIDFTLAHEGHTRISVLDVAGRQVDKLVDTKLGPGLHSLVWNPRVGGNLPAGVYFVRWESPDGTGQRSLVLTP